MPESSWIKKNIVLVAGIALPLVIVVLFGVATVVPALTVAEPTYAMVFTTGYYQNNDEKYKRTRLSVVQGKLTLTALPETDENKYDSLPNIYFYDPVKKESKEITYSVKDKNDDGDVPLKGLEDVLLDESEKAPDGYEFRDQSYRYRNGGLLLGDLFGGSYSNGCALAKDGKVVRIRLDRDDNYYSGCYNVKLLGWVKK